MPQVGETRSDGKVWAGSDYGWQNPQTIWRTIKPPQDAVPGKTTKTLPGSLGTKVWTGKDYGWQTQATIDAKTKSSSSQQTPPPAPVLPPPDPATPAPATPAPATPAPRQQAPAPKQQAPAPKPKTWAEANPRLAEVERLRAQQRSAGKSVFDKEFRTNVINPVMYNAGVPGIPGAGRSVEDSKKMYPDKPKPQTEETMDKEPFDLVLEYLTSEGHVDTLDEALYVMMEMDSETIQSICEAKYGTKKGRKALAKKVRAGKNIGKKGPGTGFSAVKKAAEKGGARDPEAVAAAAMWKTYGGKK